jgi:tetratricopeptide (TPR) repeat protein/energy-coupling factor transporter ATP-binding protein EcfA2
MSGMEAIGREGKGILRIFLSSSFRDLKGVRKVFLKKMGEVFDAKGMETFIPSGERSQKVALDELLKCDVVIFLISPYYGSDIASCMFGKTCKAKCGMKTGREKISYTWCEYRFSVAEGKPRLSYIINDETWPSKDGSPKVWEFRKEVEAKEYCSRINTDKKSIETIVSNLVSNILDWYSGNRVNLKTFCGRRLEIKDLFEKVGKGKCVEVCGVGGVGKTTLCEVVLVLYKALGNEVVYIGTEEAYSSGTGYVEASRILTPKRVKSLSIDAIIDTLRLPPEIKKENIDSIIKNILLKIENDKIILFLDNPKDDDILKELIKSGNTSLTDGSILVTSKKELGVAYHRLSLSGVEEDERLRLADMMSSRLGKTINDENMKIISDLVEGHPVATYLLISNLERVGISKLESFKTGLDFSRDEDVKEYMSRVIEGTLSEGAHNFLKDLSIISKFDGEIDTRILSKVFPKKEELGELVDAKIMQIQGSRLLFEYNQILEAILEDVPGRYYLPLQYYREKFERTKEKGDAIKVSIAQCKTKYEPEIYKQFRELYSLMKPIEPGLELLPILGEEIRRYLTEKEKARISNMLGNIYWNLSNYKVEKAENCRKAIEAFEEALKVYSLKRFPIQYAMTQNNLGMAYKTLAEVEAKGENCKKAIEACKEALKIRTLEHFPMDYAVTQNNLGNAYKTLAEVEAKGENCKKAIEAYEGALKVWTLERFPMDYAMTQNNLGTAYGMLARVEANANAKAENCKKAIGAFEEALKIRTLEHFPMDYAMTQNNLGAAYGTLAEVEAKGENCKKAIEAFEEALKIRTLEHFPMDYAMTQNDLGNAYKTLAEVEAKGENCEKAIEAYEEALKFYTLKRFPMQYAMTQNNLGTAYRTLAGVEAKGGNCKKAIEAFKEALKIRTLEHFPMDYAVTQDNLGNAYRTLAGVEAKGENCKKAIEAFKEALKVYTLGRFPMQYAMTQNNLGTAYGTLARVEAKGENCKKAIEACREALKVFTEAEFPEFYKLVARNLRLLYAFCGGK